MIINDREYLALQAYVHDFISVNCIEFGEMPGKLPGTVYDWMFYLRRATMNPDVSFALSKMFLWHMERLSPDWNFQICGMESAAVPLVTSLSLSARYFDVHVNAISCRKERKAYGLQNRFEGIPNDKIVVCMDDLCNSGKSLKTCFDAVQDEGMTPANVAFCIVNKVNSSHSDERKFTDMYLPKDVRVVSLFNLDDFNLNHPSH